MTDTSKEAVERLAKAFHDGPLGAEEHAFDPDSNSGKWCISVAEFFYAALAQRCADLELERDAAIKWRDKYQQDLDANIRSFHGRAANVWQPLYAEQNRRANRAESERDAIAAAMVEAAAKLAEQYWGAGHHADQIRALTPAEALVKLAQIRAEERAAAWRAAADICRVSQKEQAEGGWRSEGMEMARVLRSAILAAMEKEQGE